MTSSAAPTNRYERLFDRAELLRSFWWASGVTAPLCIAGWTASMALAHAGGFVLVFFAPALLVLKLADPSAPIPISSEAFLAVLAVLAQFLGSFGVVHIIRVLLRGGRSDASEV